MKIKNIAAICKKNKYAVIYERYGESGGVIQYIGGGAVFCNPPYGREIGKWVKKAYEEAIGGVRYCATYSGADGYDLFSRLHIRESGNPVRSRAASLHRRRRERERSRALPFYGSYL